MDSMKLGGGMDKLVCELLTSESQALQLDTRIYT